jgi:hypothetical protein
MHDFDGVQKDELDLEQAEEYLREFSKCDFKTLYKSSPSKLIKDLM